MKIYLFGSWAQGKEKYSSDIDLGIWVKSEKLFRKLALLRIKLEESTIPYKVDIVDLTKVDETFLKKVEREFYGKTKVKDRSQ